MPPTEKRGRVHTSTVTVAVIDLLASEERPFYEDDVEVQWFSGTGPGGQHRNKCQNSCRVIHKPTGLSETRQGRVRHNNYQEALAALQTKVGSMMTRDNAKRDNVVRKQQTGSGMRGDKIRTIRFQDDAVIDHRTNRRMRATDYMNGRMNQLW